MDNSVRISSVLRSSNLCLINPRSSSSSRFLCSQRNPDESPENDNGEKESNQFENLEVSALCNKLDSC
ncbi:hypothetical protein Bca52824_040639 [Brassica carinata]|uniref:Uncharacterized protein n=1 Tax=Brassica carinata TaxID=52824 RepID=A0A8X7UVP3_BRACI|nr:hypothetical protein Bca52824_040639 [Brassica carinata]